MRKNLSKKIKSLAMIGVISCGLSVTALQSKSFANTSESTSIEFSLDEYGNTEVITNTKNADKEEILKEFRDNNRVTANVEKKKSADTSTSPRYWANGWVTIADKTTGKGVRHYTTARLVSTTDATVHSSSERMWGVGHVPASSTNDRTVNNNNTAKIYYGLK